ncbi:uncharacterized protein LOC119091225 [Pollicipes pollicipes]|uniref:uncharacterized protein LOC119091225 n=1 Tax=Pollicipes pollicipes TaxID=41117 RepID=UPI001884A0CB|nr:uncharacterized protein LOC119091225 [Pollicipes pollicipes]
MRDVVSVFTVPRAQLGINRSVAFTCDSARQAVTYQAYVMFSSYNLRGDYNRSKEAISLMVTPESLKAHAIPVSGREPSLPLRYTLALYRGYTALYGVAVTSPRWCMPAAYVPAVHHSCPVLGLDEDPDCSAEVSPHFYLTAALLTLAGMTLLTAGAGRLAVQVLLTTAVLVAALTALLFRRLAWDEPNAALGVGVVAGLLCAAAYTRLWTSGRCPRGYMTFSMALLFGLSVGAVFFFIPALQIPDLASDLVFWPALILVVSVLSFGVLLPSLDVSLILIRSLLGSVWIMIAVSMLTSSMTHYVFTNLFRRAIYPKFRFAILQMGFLAQDYVAVFTFGLLLLVSVSVSCVLWLRQPAAGRAATERRGERRRLLPEGHAELQYGTSHQAPPSA